MRPRSVPKARVPRPARLACLLSGALFSADALGQPTPRDAAPPSAGSAPHLQVEINPHGYTTSRVCGTCHVEIYNSWKNSMHAFSLTDPIFEAAYMQALKEVGDEARRICLRCHAPMTMGNGDYELAQAVTIEGVSCDFCHTVTAVRLDDPERPYVLEPGLVKRSVLKKAASPKHEVAYSELHAKSEFCGGCHSYTSPHGARVMSTYDEWLRGPYKAEGKQCQDCHMVLTPGRVVSAEVKRSTPTVYNSHALIHDSDQIRSALAVEIVRVQRTPLGVDVDVAIENVGSAHMVPTGMPSREIVLRVEARAGARTWDAERRYRKVIADSAGRILEQDYECLLYGASIVSDNRLAPRDKRLERFTFDVPRNQPVSVSAVTTYMYRPRLLKEQNISIELTKSERVVH